MTRHLTTLAGLALAAACANSTKADPTESVPTTTPPPVITLADHTTPLCTPTPLTGTLPPSTSSTEATLTLQGRPTDLTLDPGLDGAFAIDPALVPLDDLCPRSQAPCTLEATLTVLLDAHTVSTSATLTLTDEGILTAFPDADGDGYGSDTAPAEFVCDDEGYADQQGDCNDALDSVNAGVATDVCNDIDDDCDGDTDEDGVFSNYYPDLDGDGFGAEGGTAELRCDVPNASEMLAPNDADCVDDPSVDPYASAIHPEADEMCDGFDNDCDGGIDDDDPDGPDDGLSYFLDKDGDGAFHNVEEFRCNVPGVQGVDYVLTAPAPGDVDCDDTDAALNRKDLDLDGFDTCGGDCDDGTFGVNPDADELLGNNFDEDCDGYIGCYADLDNDGHGALTDTDLYALPVPLSCDDAGNDYASIADDCLDEASADGANAFPGNPAGDDPSDGLDNDCSGVLACYIDFDRDDYGGTSVDETTVPATNGRGDCDAVDDLATTNTDCIDTDSSINPGASELVADGTDQDCDGFDDCYEDQDQDGFGSMTEVVEDAAAPGACDSPSQRLSDNATDCDDGDDQTFPGGTDLPGDDINQDCLDGYLCFVDEDGDGFGSMTTADFTDVCSSASGASTRSDDCDDTPGSGFDINPDGTETVGNNDDEDCNGIWLCYEDGDVDGFAGATISSPAPGDNCETSGFGILNTDCNDGSPLFAPGAAELPGEDDRNCDGSIECYDDSDNDTFGDDGNLVLAYVTPGGSSTCGTLAAPLTSPNNLDCDPGDGDRFPDAPEIACDGVQQDCDGTAVADARVAILDSPALGFSPDDTTFDGTAEEQLTDALAAASAGETVRLCPSPSPPDANYTGSFVITEPIILEGNNAIISGGVLNAIPDLCPSGSEPVFTVDGTGWSSDLELYDLTLTNGCNEDTIPSEHGGALDLFNATVYAERLDLRLSAASNGGGLALRNSEMTWLAGELYGNRATNGGGAWVDAASTLDIGSNDPFDGVRVDLNTATTGNGGGVFSNGATTMTESIVTSNRASAGNGGGIYSAGPSTVLDAVEFTSNSTPAGNGISLFVVGNDGYPSFTPYEVTLSGITNNDGINNVYTAFGGIDTTNGNTTCTESGCF